APPKGDEQLPLRGNCLGSFAQSAKLHSQTAQRFETAARSYYAVLKCLHGRWSRQVAATSRS
ncbi:MAG: hypothetical protein LBL31_06390, partial [Spirochaetaceae bacterium]|nr:hypothetical protein [Spirochaetaceae bacterium]